MKRIIRLAYALVVVFSSAFAGNAQSISGRSTVLSYSISNSVEVYQITITGPLDKPLPKWTISGGTIDQQFMPMSGTTTYKVGVKWNNTVGISATGSVGFDYDIAGIGHFANYPITIYGSIPAPSTAIQAAYNCGSTTITRTASPPSDNTILWYWQTSTGGTRTDLGTASSITLSAASDIYLRSESTLPPYPWGGELYLGNIGVYTTTPSAAAVAHGASNYANAPITLSVDPVVGATGYKWYSQSSGGAAIPGVTGTSYTVNLSSTTSYYVSAILGPCESSSRLQVTATVLPLPTNLALINPSCALLYDASLQNTYFYRYDMTGIPIDHSRWSISGGQILASGNDGSIYYAVVKWTSLGSGSVQFINDFPLPSGPAPINAIVYDVNAPLGVALNTNQYNCGNTVVSLGSSPGSCEYWYWQKTGDTQTDLGNSSSITLTTSGDLYIRRKWNIYPYPWGARQLVGTVIVYPQISATITPAPSALIQFNSSGVLLNANTGTNFTYQWLKDGQFISNELASSLLAKTLGNYTVKISSNVCTATSEPTVVTLQNDYNYIIVRDIQSDKKADGSPITEAEIPLLPVQLMLENITYFDGLGRPMQSVSTQASPNKTDLVTPVVYDAFGRESKKYLPIAVGNDGWYKPNTEIIDAAGNYMGIAANFYNTPSSKIAVDPTPYSVTTFEPSPLNRALKQGAPGNTWQPNTDPYSLADNTVKKRYETNAAEEVFLFLYDTNTGLVSLAAVAPSRYYGANQLYANKTYDEHNNEVIEYIDKEGRTVCKKVYAETVNTVKQYASTYYLYDDLGNLVVVLPPEAVKKLGAN
jgi:Domain of unknown function (DUF6443)/Ig-like domain CHU_C associated